MAQSMSQNKSGPVGSRNSVTSSRSLPNGVRLNDRYIINRVLGVGGFGVTYLAYDNKLNTACAIKEYFPLEWAIRESRSMAIKCSKGCENYFEHGMMFFIEEANLLIDLKNESGVMNVWDVFCDYGTIFMVMEFIDGISVSDYMKKSGRPLRLDQGGELLMKIAGALGSIHRAMLLHRDVSPDNIMMKQDGAFVLIDFGSTRAYAIDTPNSFSVLVKPGFAPIEQYSKGGIQGPWTDIYSLAATYYYAVSGKKVPPAPDREMGEPLVPLNRYVPSLAPQINRAITRALSTRSEDRQQTMDEFMYSLHI